ILGPAPNHVCGGCLGKTKRRIDEQAGVLAEHEFLVHALLTDLHVCGTVEKGLLVPNFPKPRGAIRLVPARGIQAQEILQGQLAPMNLQSADVEGAALPAESLLRIQPQAHLGQAFRDGTLLDAAREIAQRLARFLKAEVYPIRPKPRAKPTHVAQQVAALPETRLVRRRLRERVICPQEGGETNEGEDECVESKTLPSWFAAR